MLTLKYSSPKEHRLSLILHLKEAYPILNELFRLIHNYEDSIQCIIQANTKNDTERKTLF